MNMLVDLLPETVEVDGEKYEINTDFRISVLFELLMQDDEVTIKEKIIQGLRLYYPVIPPNIHEAVEKMLWFYRCGKEVVESDPGSDSSSDKQPEKVYSFEHDDSYIYAAFLQQYGVDLQEVEKLHWWKFRAMFISLGENTEFVKIMGYRSIKTTSNMSKEQREFYRKMQKIHALPVSEKEREAEAILREALMNGDDISGLLQGGS